MPRQSGESGEVSRPGQPLGLEAAHLAGRGGPTHWRAVADHPTHCRVAAQPLGVGHVLIAGRPAEYRLPKQPDQEIPSVFAGACLRQSLAAACRQSEHVVQFATGQQSAIGGRRDAEGAVSREETLANARAISADLEDGFGPRPEDAAETIRRAAAIGLVGGSIEDTTADPARPIHDFGHAVERVAAAVKAARELPFPFTVTARAENFLFSRPDLGDTVARLRAFEAAGADVLYAPGLPDMAAIREV